MQLTSQTIRILLEAIFWGVVATLVLILGFTFGELLSSRYLSIHPWLTTWKGGVVFIISFALLLSYLWFREFPQTVWKVFKSFRIDIFVATGLSALVVLNNWDVFSTYIHGKFGTLGDSDVLSLFILLFILFFSALIHICLQARRSEKPELKFVSDDPIKDSEDDLLGFSEKADSFAENVFHASRGRGLVFGIDAPWGSGKSSFINLCKKYWETKYKDELIVYEFSPLQYSADANLLERFVDGLVKEIQKNVFVPEIRPLFSQYSKLIKIVNGLTILGIKIPEFSNGRTVNDVHNDLACALNQIERKIVVIVDDLDRIELSEIKKVLFAIRESFKFPNISYVLCYDTENINALEADSPEIETINEFLEKFVNIKTSIFLDRENLWKFVSEKLDTIIADKTTDPLLVSTALDGLREIFQSSEFYRYANFVGDIRKLKRLINIVVLLELHKTNFEKTDINRFDLVHLLLIYINYPSIFRKIYNTETAGNYGFFSVVGPYDDAYPKDKKMNGGNYSDSTYENSDAYREYLGGLTPNQKFLVGQVFEVVGRLNRAENVSSATALYGGEHSNRIDNVTEDTKTSLACFNGGKFTDSGRNLEDYLRLIAHLAQPEEERQFAPFRNWRDGIIAGTLKIDTLFSQPEFSAHIGEQKRQKLWRLIINNTRKLNQTISSDLIKHLTKNITRYSLLEIESLGIGLRRHDLAYFLIRLLNDAGYEGSMNGNNTEENIKEIAEWVFGEERHKDEGILDALAEPDRGILGLYDLLDFRLLCSSDRGGNIFNVSRAIAKHGSNKAPTEGDTRIIAKEEMREMSQKIFGVFKSRYIDKKINIFSEASKLSLNDVAGDYAVYVQTQVKNGVVSDEKLQSEIEATKSSTVSFIVYQLGNDLISHGVGCGFYDPTGNKDEHTIRKLVNDYLFDVCFDPKIDKNNYENLLTFLLRNIPFDALTKKHFDKIPDFQLKTIVGVLEIERLADFWKTHRDEIKKARFENTDKKCLLGTRYINSTAEDIFASFEKDLPRVYKVLDEYVDNDSKAE